MTQASHGDGDLFLVEMPSFLPLAFAAATEKDHEGYKRHLCEAAITTAWRRCTQVFLDARCLTCTGPTDDLRRCYWPAGELVRLEVLHAGRQGRDRLQMALDTVVSVEALLKDLPPAALNRCDWCHALPSAATLRRLHRKVRRPCTPTRKGDVPILREAGWIDDDLQLRLDLLNNHVRLYATGARVTRRMTCNGQNFNSGPAWVRDCVLDALPSLPDYRHDGWANPLKRALLAGERRWRSALTEALLQAGAVTA